MNTNKSINPPAPHKLPHPPIDWLKENDVKQKKIIFCYECENVYYVFDDEKQCLRQYLYECKCENVNV